MPPPHLFPFAEKGRNSNYIFFLSPPESRFVKSISFPEKGGMMGGGRAYGGGGGMESNKTRAGIRNPPSLSPRGASNIVPRWWQNGGEKK